MTMPWSKDTASARTCIAKSREEPLATLENVWIDIAVVLGKTLMPIHQVPRLGRGANVELDSSEPDEVRILANNLPVAKGTVIVSRSRIAVGEGTSAACARRMLKPTTVPHDGTATPAGPCP
jgi:flagellar motor switch protein FliN/FliY